MEISVKERPILFSGSMVRAILEGRKTVTRRVIKPGFPTSVTEVLPYVNAPGAWIPSDPHNSEEPWDEQVRICPYGQPGDRLWVRESWGLQVRSYGGGAGEYIVYRATNPDAIYCRSSEGREYPVKWKPSIHMRRHSSRILLEITAVRVERLLDISEEQARAEGIDLDHLADAQERYDMVADHNMTGRPTAVSAFRDLWASINGIESWDANPWVWVVEFKRVTP